MGYKELLKVINFGFVLLSLFFVVNWISSLVMGNFTLLSYLSGAYVAGYGLMMVFKELYLSLKRW